jgi:site-specific DNA recombinase
VSGDTLIYTRVSSDEQAQRGNSLDEQKTTCEEYCRRNGWHFPADGIYEARDESTQLMKRPVFDRMIARLERERGFLRVLVSKFDRFSRNQAWEHYAIGRLIEWGLRRNSWVRTRGLCPQAPRI